MTGSYRISELVRLYLVASPPARLSRRRPFILADAHRNSRKLTISPSVGFATVLPRFVHGSTTSPQHPQSTPATTPAIRECPSQSITSAAESPMPATAARLERSSATAKCPAATAPGGSGLTHVTIRRSAVDGAGSRRDHRRILIGSRGPGQRGILRLRRLQ